MGVTKILEKGTKVVTDMKRKAKTTAGFVEQGKRSLKVQKKKVIGFFQNENSWKVEKTKIEKLPKSCAKNS
jgi:hypothetical protein